jgi:hypothetical protein
VSAFDIANLSLNFEDVAGALSAARRLTAADREILQLRLAALRRFMTACEANKTEIENILNWTRRS